MPLGCAIPLWQNLHDGKTSLSALELLDAMFALPSTEGLSTGWEVRSGQTFLSLRTVDRDVWRAGRLPPALLEAVDAIVRPQLPVDRKSFDLQTSLPLEAWSRRLGALTELQLSYGMQECYGDPTQPLGAARHAFLAALRLYANDAPVLRWLASLTPKQWTRLRTTGLVAPADLTPEQTASLYGFLGHGRDPSQPQIAYDQVSISLNADAPGQPPRTLGGKGRLALLLFHREAARNGRMETSLVWSNSVLPKVVQVHVAVPNAPESAGKVSK